MRITLSRRLRLLILAVAGAALLMLLTVIAPSRARAIRNGKSAFDPLVQALEQFRSRHDRYPTSLNELTGVGTVASIPDVPTYWNVLERPLNYRVSRDNSVFCVSFSYTGVWDRHRTHVYYLSSNG